MIFDFLFQKEKQRAEHINRAQAKISVLEKQREALETKRKDGLQRQVELWSITNLDSNSEAEYLKVSALIAQLIKQIAAIDEYICDVREACALYEKTSNATLLEKLLAIEDPWAEKIKLGTQDALPRITA